MSDKTRIEWTDATWPVVAGCTRVSAGCENCWAIRHSWRLSYNLLVDSYRGIVEKSGCFPRQRSRLDWTGEVRCLLERLDWPLRWKKPRRIFVSPMGDLFHKLVSRNFQFQVFGIMAQCHQHTFQILTKRPQRMLDWFRETEKGGPFDPLPNVWIGVSCEDQKTADERVPILLQTPAAVRFVSLEPLLGPIDLADAAGVTYWDDASAGIRWVIVGGETGPGARPLHPDWVRSIRDQCQAAGVPFFFKSWGGKKAAGRELDGRTWEEMPR